MKNKRLIFIDVVGWILTIFSGIGLLIVTFQNIMINFIFPPDDLEKITNHVSSTEGISSFVFQNPKITIAILGLITLYAFMSSIAFLKRKEWARQSLIALFSIGILYNILSLIAQWSMMKSMNNSISQIDDNFERMSNFVYLFSVVFSAGLSIIFGWLIVKISSKKIREEFMSNSTSQLNLPTDESLKPEKNEKQENTTNTRFWLYEDDSVG
jgi:hypothetical protein